MATYTSFSCHYSSSSPINKSSHHHILLLPPLSCVNLSSFQSTFTITERDFIFLGVLGAEGTPASTISTLLLKNHKYLPVVPLNYPHHYHSPRSHNWRDIIFSFPNLIIQDGIYLLANMKMKRRWPRWKKMIVGMDLNFEQCHFQLDYCKKEGNILDEDNPNFANEEFWCVSGWSMEMCWWGVFMIIEMVVVVVVCSNKLGLKHEL